jgi:hypothetical protein
MPVLEYRGPVTRGRQRSPFIDARYPLVLILMCAIATPYVPTRVGGSTPAWVTSFFLVAAGCWYAVVRVVEDRRYRVLWRAVISVAAVCSIVTVPDVAAVGRLRQGWMWWSAYGEILTYLYPPIFCVASLITASIAAWIDLH